MRNLFTIFVLSTLLSIGYSANATDLQNLDDYPKWFKDAMVNEAKLNTTSSIEIKALGVKGEVAGKFTLAEQDGTFWYYTVDIGSTTPIECYAFTSFDGPANSLHYVMGLSIDNTAAAHEMKLSSTLNYAVDAGVIDDTPYISADTLYNISDSETSLSGVVKGKSARTSQSLQLCVHNEIGYRDTFTKVFTSFVEVFTKSEADPEFFEVVYKISLNGIHVGFVEERYTFDAEGDVSIANNSAMLMPVDANNFARIDSVSDSFSTSDGSIINANEYTVQNGVLASNFSLSYADEAWQVVGEMQGKEVTKTLEHDGWFLSGYGSYLVLENLRKSEASSGEYTMWSSSVDPSSALPVKLRQLSDNPNANFEVDMGPLVMQFLADEKGIFQRGTINQGPIKLGMTLMHARGLPTTKSTTVESE